MASKNFLLVSLEESKAKELAQIVSNDVCRKILDFLTGVKTATETEISRQLGIPLSTVHYNLKQLQQSGIVKAEEFHYSEKGREVLHYSLANRYIIIAPKATATESLANKLKRILPVAGFVAATGIALQFYTAMKKASVSALGTAYSDTAVVQKAAEAGGAGITQAAQAANAGAQAAAGTVSQAIGNETTRVAAEQGAAEVVRVVHAQPSIALWFAIGAVFALVVYLIYDVIRENRK